MELEPEPDEAGGHGTDRRPVEEEGREDPAILEDRTHDPPTECDEAELRDRRPGAVETGAWSLRFHGRFRWTAG